MSDSLKQADSYMWQFRSLQISLLLCAFVAVVGGAFFLTTALFIEKDRYHAENYVPSGEWFRKTKMLCFSFDIYLFSYYHFIMKYTQQCHSCPWLGVQKSKIGGALLV